MTAPTILEPTWHTHPHYEVTLGPEAVEFAALAGLVLDPEQGLILDDVYGLQPGSGSVGGRWAAREVCVVCGRQNIKTTTYEAAALYDLLELAVPLHIWSAHLYRTAVASFVEIKDRIDNHDHLRRLIRSVSTSKGDEAIETVTGARLEFAARSRRSGRGLSGDVLTLDEAFELQPAQVGALLPIMSARSNPQLRYGSSAGMLTSEVLRSVRDRGRDGDPRLAYLEWGAPRQGCGQEPCSHVIGSTECALDDPELVGRANPALGRRLTLEFIQETERRAMTPVEFARERLGWWEDPPVGGGALPTDVWGRAAENPPPLVGPSFGVDLDEAGIGYFAVAWKRPDGLIHVQLAGRTSASKLQERADELTGKHGGAVFAGGPALKLLDRCEPVGGQEFAAACKRLEDLLAGDGLRHCDEADLNAAVALARWRSVGSDGAQAWQLKDAPGIGPLAAATRALHGLVNGPSVYESRGLTVLGAS